MFVEHLWRAVRNRWDDVRTRPEGAVFIAHRGRVKGPGLGVSGERLSWEEEVIRDAQEDGVDLIIWSAEGRRVDFDVEEAHMMARAILENHVLRV